MCLWNPRGKTRASIEGGKVTEDRPNLSFLVWCVVQVAASRICGPMAERHHRERPFKCSTTSIGNLVVLPYLFVVAEPLCLVDYSNPTFKTVGLPLVTRALSSYTVIKGI
jgi:hypothetical protein